MGLAGFTAFVALIVGFVSLCANRANMLADKRQAWIEGLRNDVSELVGYIHKREGYQDKIYQLGSRIELRLNPSEEAHNKLLVHLNIINPVTNFSINDDYINQILNLTKFILKEEWDRIKKESKIPWVIKDFFKFW